MSKLEEIPGLTFEKIGVTEAEWGAMINSPLSGGPLFASRHSRGAGGGSGGEWHWRTVMRALIRKIVQLHEHVKGIEEQMFIRAQAYESLRKDNEMLRAIVTREIISSDEKQDKVKV